MCALHTIVTLTVHSACSTEATDQEKGVYNTVLELEFETIWVHYLQVLQNVPLARDLPVDLDVDVSEV